MSFLIPSVRAPEVPTPAFASSAHSLAPAVHIAPLVLLQLYLTGSLLAFAFGPLQLEAPNPPLLIGYALLGQLVLLAGYVLGVSRPTRGDAGPVSGALLLGAAVVAVLVLLPPTLAERNYTGVSAIEAISDPGAAYHAFQAHFRSPSAVRPLSIVRAALAPLTALLLPLGIVYWRRTPFGWRSLWLAAVAAQVVVALLDGRAFGLFDIVLVLPWFVWLRWHRRVPRERLARGNRPLASSRWRRRLISATLALAILVAGLWYFSYSRHSRSRVGKGDFPAHTIGWLEDSYGVTVPQSVEFTAYYVLRYWSMGYIGLAGCLELPFEWTGGLGHSTFLARYATRYDPDLAWIEPATYPFRLEARTGYSAQNYWHTIYPWLASDLTFGGALLFVGLMAFLLASAWNDSLLGRNPFALGALAQLLLFFFYVPASNVRLASPESAAAFWGLLILWLATRR